MIGFFSVKVPSIVADRLNVTDGLKITVWSVLFEFPIAINPPVLPEPIKIAPPNCDEPILISDPVAITSNEFHFTFPFAVIKPVDVSGPALVVVIPDDPSVIAVAVDVPNDNVPADAVVSDGDVKAEAFITPVEEIEPVLDPFLNNVPIIFPDDAVIFPLVSVIDVEKVGEIIGAYVVDASADVK